MLIIDKPLHGCRLLEAGRFKDHRGDFVKTFHHDDFLRLGLPVDWKEEFFSTSRLGVLRGMHFQLPPHDHSKLVWCIRGRVLDVVLDLRKGDGFGRSVGVELSQANQRGLYIPKGVAHGFLALEDDSVMFYKTTSVHAPSHDSGILWSSFSFSWPTNSPIISTRDSTLPTLADLSSPF